MHGAGAPFERRRQNGSIIAQKPARVKPAPALASKAAPAISRAHLGAARHAGKAAAAAGVQVEVRAFAAARTSFESFWLCDEVKQEAATAANEKDEDTAQRRYVTPRARAFLIVVVVVAILDKPVGVVKPVVVIHVLPR